MVKKAQRTERVGESVLKVLLISVYQIRVKIDANALTKSQVHNRKHTDVYKKPLHAHTLLRVQASVRTRQTKTHT